MVRQVIYKNLDMPRVPSSVEQQERGRHLWRFDINYPHFMGKGPSHTINNVLKASRLISIRLGLPDSLA